MQSSSQIASSPFAEQASGFVPSRPAEDRVYQAMTIAAILMVLGSLWVF
jgi:hypothetical protein